jgi:hypothetical protein
VTYNASDDLSQLQQTKPTVLNGNPAISNIWWQDGNLTRVAIWLDPCPTIYLVRTTPAQDVLVFAQRDLGNTDNIGKLYVFSDKTSNPTLYWYQSYSGSQFVGVRSQQFTSDNAIMLICTGNGDVTRISIS